MERFSDFVAKKAMYTHFLQNSSIISSPFPTSFCRSIFLGRNPLLLFIIFNANFATIDDLLIKLSQWESQCVCCFKLSHSRGVLLEIDNDTIEDVVASETLVLKIQTALSGGSYHRGIFVQFVTMKDKKSLSRRKLG